MPVRPLQPCPTCGIQLCCGDDPFSYSLVNGPVYENDQVAINFECPPGFTCIAGTYVIPAGRIRFIPNGDTLRLQCCHSEIVRPVPAGATTAEIGVIAQAMVNACALQAAQCAGEATINQGSSFNHGFNNTGFCVEAGCPPGQLLGYTGSAPFLGNGLTMECGRICIAPAIFTSTSVAAANTRARNYILSQISFFLGNGTLQCGYWNAEQECPGDPPVTIPECTFFSVTSQEAADQLALDSCVLCGSGATVGIIGYTDGMFTNPGQTGTLIGTFEITAVTQNGVVGTMFTGNVTPNNFATWTAMQETTAVTVGGNIVTIRFLFSAEPEQYEQSLYGGCNSGESLPFGVIGQTLSFYDIDASSTFAGEATNPWDGQFEMAGGGCAAFTALQCVGIAGQTNVTLAITDANPHVLTVAKGSTIIWEGSSVDILGPYVRTAGTSLIPADLSLEVIS